MSSVLQSRSNFQELNSFCEVLAFGSGLECLYLTLLLLEGAQPAFLAPNMIPRRLPHGIVCPSTREAVDFRPFPCLISSNAIIIPQVTFATPRLYTVDFLVNSKGVWNVVELDGRGHDPHGDRERTLALGLPVVRLNEEQVLKRVREALGLAA